MAAFIQEKTSMKKTGLFIMMGSLLFSLTACTVNERALSNIQKTDGAEGGSSSAAASSSEMEKDGREPVVSGGILTYGLYPQKRVSDASLLAALGGLETPEANGWYLLDDVYYAKLAANPQESHQFDDGTMIESGATYWFRCDPIEWKVLFSSNGEAFVVSNELLDMRIYAASGSNNYKESDMRAWLNGAFLSSAFSLGDSAIETTLVGNSAETTDASPNEYACENTNDKVFLLSYQDCTNSLYALSEGASLRCRPTDWAKAMGAFCDPNSPEPKYGLYWTRSPSSQHSYASWGVNYQGELRRGDVANPGRSVRPAMRVKIA